MLTKLSRTFTAPAGYSLAQLSVRVSGSTDNNPARLYSSFGTTISKDGVVPVGAAGVVEVYVQDTTTYNLELFVTETRFLISKETSVDPAAPAIKAPVITTAADIIALINASAPLRAAIKAAAA